MTARQEPAMSPAKVLKERQRRELAAVTGYEKALEKERAARVATAKAVAKLVEVMDGAERAAEIIGMPVADVLSEVRRAEEAEVAEATAATTPSDDTDPDDETPDGTE
ncbi:hypothetical protein [Allostreptomyces psammosilenae]|uniref:Molecular chaperone GrpE (Heat shock protein) n=1 Tax=Allostreptomyces psammosilenae TaxID=1892865 RepID=A0A853A1F9_9ACTN|nr:hypothetical protein [Allostreptomyces psammosilenae]NYI08199.1 molecular chaperone GrpE (heat shock protein) [Allostreptomyces psammosilenae]